MEGESVVAEAELQARRSAGRFENQGLPHIPADRYIRLVQTDGPVDRCLEFVLEKAAALRPERQNITGARHGCNGLRQKAQIAHRSAKERIGSTVRNPVDAIVKALQN